MVIGLNRAAKPRIRAILAILDPIIVPDAISIACVVGSSSWVIADNRETENSGRDVAMATRVTPIENSEIPHIVARRVAYFAIQSAPLIRQNRPAMKMSIGIMGIINYCFGIK